MRIKKTVVFGNRRHLPGAWKCGYATLFISWRGENNPGKSGKRSGPVKAAASWKP